MMAAADKMSGDAPDGLLLGEDGKLRCFWSAKDAPYQRYHDEEWGEPIVDDDGIFERMALEGFQAGLSWITILRKRENFREAFRGFHVEDVAAFGEDDVLRLLDNSGIIRHRGKIEAAIRNARAILRLRETHASLLSFMAPWFLAAIDEQGPTDSAAAVARGSTPVSLSLSNALKAEGFRFVGPTGVYAMLQALGVVSDHIDGCWRCEQGAKNQARWREILAPLVAAK